MAYHKTGSLVLDDTKNRWIQNMRLVPSLHKKGELALNYSPHSGRVLHVTVDQWILSNRLLIPADWISFG